MKVLMLFVAALFTMSATACAPGGSSVDEPPGVRVGTDICDQCHMIISDERFASAYRTAGGTERRFDDIGDMAVYHSIRAENVRTFWVHDVDTLEWLRAPQAWFVRSEEIMSPMGHGLAGYGSEARAIAAAEAIGGEVVRWDEVLAGAVLGH